VSNKGRQDMITLAGIKIHPHVGITPEERKIPQECHADLLIYGNFVAASLTDSLDKSIDYSEVLRTVQRTAEAQEYNLVETLAFRIVRAVLDGFPVNRVCVKIRKRPASLIEEIDFVEITTEETRNEK
jgi:7,8-dihydroneopterin aldolase/epimerase/oxygenase